MARFELKRSDKTNATGEYRWFVLPTDGDTPCFSPNIAGNSGLKACETWLTNQGAKQVGDVAPDCFLYA